LDLGSYVMCLFFILEKDVNVLFISEIKTGGRYRQNLCLYVLKKLNSHKSITANHSQTVNISWKDFVTKLKWRGLVFMRNAG